MSATAKRSKRNILFGRKPRFIANGEEARDSRNKFESANLRATGYATTPMNRANIPG